jgi:hypothetical protein
VLSTVFLGFAATSLAVTAEEFGLRTGADFAALCSTPADDPLYTAAIHMCHGFGAGTYQAILAMTRHEKLEPLFCPPEPAVSRNEAVQMFLEWAKRNPQYLGERPADVIGRFFVQQFKCSSK